MILSPNNETAYNHYPNSRSRQVGPHSSRRRIGNCTDCGNCKNPGNYAHRDLRGTLITWKKKSQPTTVVAPEFDVSNIKTGSVPVTVVVDVDVGRQIQLDQGDENEWFSPSLDVLELYGIYWVSGKFAELLFVLYSFL